VCVRACVCVCVYVCVYHAKAQHLGASRLDRQGFRFQGSGLGFRV
jgi:hypothetical protein